MYKGEETEKKKRTKKQTNCISMSVCQFGDGKCSFCFYLHTSIRFLFLSNNLLHIFGLGGFDDKIKMLFLNFVEIKF